MDRGAWWAAVQGVSEPDMTEHARLLLRTKDELSSAWGGGGLGVTSVVVSSRIFSTSSELLQSK